MIIENAKKILVAPLDWGLGHTTRCVPLVRHLQEKGHTVTVAGNKTQLKYLSNAFPGIKTISLDGYDISYGKTRWGFVWSILRQLPHIFRTVRQEHQWLLHIQKEHQFDGIISDNRYGLHHAGVPCAIMTHQLQVRTGMGGSSDRLLRGMHYRYLERFKDCWIVDVPGKPNLSGNLAHPKVLPKNARYIGLLTQLDAGRQPAAETHLLILLSGPEPQRTMLSKLLWQQLQDHPGAVVFVEGTEDAPHPANIPSHITYYTRITKDALQPLLTNAGMVVCRSGYSTLMDLASLDKKAILIPTPGQTEQEYLADYLQTEQVYLSLPQQDLDLEMALKQAETFPFRPIPLAEGYTLYQEVLDQWLKQL